MQPVQREALARLRRAAAGSRQERLLRGLRAWGEAAAATSSRQQLVQGAVQRFQYAGLAGVEPLTADWWTMIEAAARLARAWQSWTQRGKDGRRPAPLTSEHLAMETARLTLLRDAALKDGDVQAAIALGASRRALQRLRWPGVAAALKSWGRGARAAARERVVLGRVSAALLRRHAAPALHTWARGARHAAACATVRTLSLAPTGAADERALRTMGAAAYAAARQLLHAPAARALRALRAATDATRRARQHAHSASTHWRRRGEATVMRTWWGTAAARGARLVALRRCVAVLRSSAATRAMAAWRACASERARAAARRRRLQAALRGGKLRHMAHWRAAASERSRRLGAARRCAVDMVHREAGAALRSWAAWRAARGAARAVASHALQRVLRAREAAALAAWREAAAATGRRRRLLRGAVQRFRHTAQARAWHSWAQARRRLHRLRALALRALHMGLIGALLTWRAAVAHRPAPPTTQALQRLRWPDLAAALQCWARGARAAARKRAFALRVSAAVLRRHAAPALHTWARGCRRRGARRAAARAAVRGFTLAQTARALLAWQATGVRGLQLTLLRHSASLALRGFGRAAALRKWSRHAARAKLLSRRRADATRYAAATRLPNPSH